MSFLYRSSQPPVRLLIRSLTDLHVAGLGNIPEKGPFFLIPNHQSMVDPFLVQAVCPRQLRSMTKSTQFASALSRFFLLRMYAFPVRRYRTDAQTVRIALRTLEAGEGVCIYPEGERSWDGALQPFRRGTLRLLLRAGVPIVPVGIEGAYDVWPRWSRRPRLGQRVDLRFGEPIVREPILTRKARDEALPGFEAELREVLRSLSGEARREMENRNPDAGAAPAAARG